MSVTVSIVGIIVASLAAMIIGMLWYSPMLFGKSWMKIIGLSDNEMKKRSQMVMVGMVILSLLTAYVMTFFITYMQNYTHSGWYKAGVETAFLLWLGVALTTIFAHGLFEPRDKKVLYINAGNRLITLLSMGLILGLFLK